MYNLEDRYVRTQACQTPSGWVKACGPPATSLTCLIYVVIQFHLDFVQMLHCILGESHFLLNVREAIKTMTNTPTNTEGRAPKTHCPLSPELLVQPQQQSSGDSSREEGRSRVETQSPWQNLAQQQKLGANSS